MTDSTPVERRDAVLPVRSPSRRAFSLMAADPEHQQITQLRRRALREAVLQPTVPWAAPDTPSYRHREQS